MTTYFKPKYTVLCPFQITHIPLSTDAWLVASILQALSTDAYVAQIINTDQCLGVIIDASLVSLMPCS